MACTAPGGTLDKQVSGLEQPSNCGCQCYWRRFPRHQCCPPVCQAGNLLATSREQTGSIHLGSPAPSPRRAGIFVPQYLLMGCCWHYEEFSQQGMAGLLHPALVTDISGKHFISFLPLLRDNSLSIQIVSVDMTQHVMQDVIGDTPPFLASFLKITKVQLHPASLKLYSVQVAIRDLAATTRSGLHGQPSSPPCAEHIPKLSVLIPDPVLSRAFPALIQQFKGYNFVAGEAPDPVCASRMHYFTSH